MASTNKTVDKNKYKYVYYVDTGELYMIDSMKSLGRYADIPLVGYEVKCWKPFNVHRLNDQLLVDNKDGRAVYLGVKL